ncbi:MAG: restriction endonuclease subunit S [Armatimonadota bacterium]
MPYLGLEQIESQTGRILSDRPTGDSSAGIGAAFRFDSRHVLYSKLRPYLNKVALPEHEGRCSTELIPLLPSAGIERDFLGFLLRSPSAVAHASSANTGARMPRADMEHLFSWEVEVPTIKVQRRIASRLKEQMTAVEQARQQVLDQIRHAEILRLKYFRDAFDESALAEWDARALLDIAHIVSGMTLGGPVAQEPTTKVPYLRVANVKDGWLMLEDVKEIDATERDIEQFQLRHGDVVLTEGGDPDKLGRGTVWREEISLCLHQNHIFRVRFDHAQVCPEFAAYQFASRYGKAYFLAHAKQTTGIASINKGVLSRFPFRLPPLATQRHIAARLRGQFEHLQQLKSALTDQLAALDHLPGAYLREAFGNFQ